MAEATGTFTVPNTPEMRYVQAFHATEDIVIKCIAKFDVIAHDATTVAARDEARARSLQAQQELHLIRDLNTAWMTGKTSIQPPTKPQVDATIAISTALAATIASDQELNAIVNFFIDAATKFNAIHNAPLPAKPQVVAAG